MAKKINFNVCYIRGEVLDIYNIRRIGEGQSWEKLCYELKIQTGEDEIVTVEAFENVFGWDGEESNKYKGLLTICNEVQTRAESGKGDMVNCNCTAVNNSYYSNGELIEKTILLLNYVNRQKDGEKIEPGTFWSIYGMIEEENESEGKLELKCLTNEYMSKNATKGTYLNFEIEGEDVEALKEMVRVGDVVNFEGEIKTVIETIFLPEEETAELEVKGLGTKREKLIKENERRRKLREEGVKKSSVKFVITGADDPLNEEDLAETPFEEDRLRDMLERLEKDLVKKKEKDDKKNGKTGIEDDVPF